MEQSSLHMQHSAPNGRLPKLHNSTVNITKLLNQELTFNPMV